MLANLAHQYLNLIQEQGKTLYQCKLCGELHLESKVLAQHLRKRHQITFGDYVCDVCGGKFLHNDSLKQHVKTKHTNGGDTSFNDRGNIESHFTKVKAQWVCKICQTHCRRRDEMRIHYIIDHLKETPKICEICGGSFTAQGLHFHKELAHFSDKLKNQLKHMTLDEGFRK